VDKEIHRKAGTARGIQHVVTGPVTCVMKWSCTTTYE